MSISNETRRVVVGVDGSPASQEPLRWAARYARLIEATVDAVTAYAIPGAAGLSAPVVDADFDEARARQDLDEEIQQVLHEAGDAPLEQQLIRGGAADALIQASAGAKLLVVGSRGRGGFARLVLGSVSQQCALHAACPVVIVRTGGHRQYIGGTGRAGCRLTPRHPGPASVLDSVAHHGSAISTHRVKSVAPTTRRRSTSSSTAVSRTQTSKKWARACSASHLPPRRCRTGFRAASTMCRRPARPVRPP